MGKARVPKCDEFRALGSGYSRFQWYSLVVLDRPDEVVVTLKPTDWRRAGLTALVISAVWLAYIGLGWLMRPQPLDYRSVATTMAIVALFPLYFPLLRMLVLRGRLPVLRLDRESGVVHLCGGIKQVPRSDVVAVCEVIALEHVGSGAESRIEVYELQLLLARASTTQPWLLTGSWHPTAEAKLAPIAASIAKGLGVPHYAVNVIEGTLTKRQGWLSEPLHLDRQGS